MARSSSSHDTPVMRQYLDAKGRYPDALLFFRLGDFYEMFFEDAIAASKALGLVLTSRDKGAEDPVPMCGVPFHSVKTYVERLLDQGFKVAICEQLEDPAAAKGIVARGVVRVITPGSNVDPELLDAGRANYLACVVPADPAACSGPYGLAAADISTGEMITVEAADDTELAGELARLGPREMLVPPAWPALGRLLEERAPGAVRTAYAATRDYLDAGRAMARIGDLLPDAPQGAAGSALTGRSLAAAASVLDYLARTQPGLALPIRRMVPVRSSDHLVLDDDTMRHLELVESASGDRRASLVGFLDGTVTPMGSRLLRSWILAPLMDVAAIRRRQDAVEAMTQDAKAREELRRMLGAACDVDRVLSRVLLAAATPREMGALRATMEVLPELGEAVRALAGPGGEPPVAVPARPAELADMLVRARADDPPPHAREGGIFRRGWNAELDELVELSTSGRDAIARMEAEERERSGIGSLKIRYNKVFGWFIEVTKANLHLVPDRYTRKQTLAGGERYLTQELKDLEARILSADEKSRALQASMFQDLLAEIARHEAALREIGASLAALDALASLAHAAVRRGWVRPRVEASGRMRIVAGRHPVVEAFGAPDGFVPNDVDLDTDGERFWIVTGPNMSGKSTFMRQVAICAIMAQAGSFIPAKEAVIGVADRIFTRVGASDNLAWGQSTFMVEMVETAAILRHATRRSLVVLDEIGRGTSTFDGMSIAWAVAEHLHDEVGARTLFSTHYHEITAIAESLPHAANYNATATEYGDGIVFLRKVEKGSASRSYGIQVARLAGLPGPVLARAREILERLEAGGSPAGDPQAGASRPGAAKPGAAPAGATTPERADAQLTLFGAPPSAPDPIRAVLEEIDVDQLTPVEALNLLARLKKS